jgi:hypothetical protein
MRHVSGCATHFGADAYAFTAARSTIPDNLTSERLGQLATDQFHLVGSDAAPERWRR